MATGRSKAQWSHTSEILAILAEVNRDPRKRSAPFTSRDFNPHGKKPETKEQPVKTVTMAELRAMMPDLAQNMGRTAMAQRSNG